jgi:hypothetical protein
MNGAGSDQTYMKQRLDSQREYDDKSCIQTGSASDEYEAHVPELPQNLTRAATDDTLTETFKSSTRNNRFFDHENSILISSRRDDYVHFALPARCKSTQCP